MNFKTAALNVKEVVSKDNLKNGSPLNNLF